MGKIYGNTTTTPLPITTVDQNYDAKSTNAQSGKAVELAIMSKANKETPQGGFIGGKFASVSTGGAVGKSAEAWKGGAVGEGATSDEGGAVGKSAKTDNGGAVGESAESTSGGVVGKDAYSERGGAIGEKSESKSGGAVGYNAKAGNGFSGGMSASVESSDSGNYIDAIQLGSGKNSNPKTLQIYNYTLMNADGSIPEERLTKAKAYTDEKIGDIETTLENNAIECTSSGTTINIKDSAEAKPRGLKLYGKTTQGENPSPENPQELISIGDSGSVGVELYGKNLFDVDSYGQFSDKNRASYIDISKFEIGTTLTISTKDAFVFKINALSGVGATANGGKQSGKVTSFTFTMSETYKSLGHLYVVSSTTWNVLQKAEIETQNVQLEIGSTSTEYEPFKKQSISILTPDGLLGIPVTSGGNYTDENGQQYISDEVDLEREVRICRLGKIDSYNGEEITTQYMSTTGELSTGSTVIYVLETPFETPLTDEEKTAYNELTLYKPTTNIFNSDNANMEVDYTADTKTYIDNKFAELQNAIISTGGNV